MKARRPDGMGNKAAHEDTLRRLQKASKEPTLARAIEAYGGGRESFWAAARKNGRNAEFKVQFAEDIRAARAAGAIKRNGSRRAITVENAEFLARTGEHPINAARRLGYENHQSLERALLRAGRQDIATALRANDRMGILDESDRLA